MLSLTTTLERYYRARVDHEISLGLRRDNLPALCAARGYRSGAEIGVWKGAFSEKFCRASRDLHMYCVDPWASYPAWRDTKNSLGPTEAAAFMEAAYQEALGRLLPLANCTILRMFSAEAAALVPDGSLDFVYIDGNHVYEAVLEDLTLWAPKVRAGGFVAGHDFRKSEKKPFIQVVEAVRDYATTRELPAIYVLDGDRTPSFMWPVT